MSCIGLPSWEGFWGSGFQKVESRGHSTLGKDLSTTTLVSQGDPHLLLQLWTWSQEMARLCNSLFPKSPRYLNVG